MNEQRIQQLVEYIKQHSSFPPEQLKQSAVSTGYTEEEFDQALSQVNSPTPPAPSTPSPEVPEVPSAVEQAQSPMESESVPETQPAASAENLEATQTLETEPAADESQSDEQPQPEPGKMAPPTDEKIPTNKKKLFFGIGLLIFALAILGLGVYLIVGSPDETTEDPATQPVGTDPLVTPESSFSDVLNSQ